MNNNDKFSIKTFSVFLLAGLASCSAFAELYVSPVVREGVTFNSADTTPNGHTPTATNQISGESKVHGDFVMKESAEKLSAVMAYGQNVPLFIAVERVVPNSGDWKINVDSGLENSVVNWEGGDTWEGVLENIARQNGLFLTINTDEKAIGISKVDGLSKHLAMQSPQVWRLEKGKSLKQNLRAWAERAGWNLEWSPDVNVDYPITHSAVLTGKFVGKGGVVDQLLYSLREMDKPLRAEFHTRNSVLLITNAGYQQEVEF